MTNAMFWRRGGRPRPPLKGAHRPQRGSCGCARPAGRESNFPTALRPGRPSLPPGEERTGCGHDTGTDCADQRARPKGVHARGPYPGGSGGTAPVARGIHCRRARKPARAARGPAPIGRGRGKAAPLKRGGGQAGERPLGRPTRASKIETVAQGPRASAAMERPPGRPTRAPKIETVAQGPRASAAMERPPGRPSGRAG